MSNTHKHEANTVDEILDRITQDGRYSSAKEFSILFVESQDTLSGLSPIQFRKAKAKQQIQALITEARIEQIMQDELSLMDTELPEEEIIQWRLDRLTQLKKGLSNE